MRLFFIALAGILPFLSGCNEEPQILEQSPHTAANADQRANEEQRRERTLRQSESTRIY